MMQENPKVFLAFGLTHMILPSDFHFGRGVAVGSCPCLAGAGCPEVVDEPPGEIFGIVAAVSDVRSKSCPLSILKKKRDQVTMSWRIFEIWDFVVCCTFGVFFFFFFPLPTLLMCWECGETNLPGAVPVLFFSKISWFISDNSKSCQYCSRGVVKFSCIFSLNLIHATKLYWKYISRTPTKR